ncbi:MAG: type III pantothenate kinase [Acutalibacteraceae bacterium]
MIFVIDIGNTQIVVGLMDGDTRKDSFRLATDRVKTAEEYALLLQGICTMRGIDLKNIEGGILSSVVPVLTPVLQDAVESLIGRRPLAVGAGVKTGLNLRVDNPGQLGSDRVVDAVAASARYKKPIFIVDMGTSTTVSVVGRDGSFLGGLIIPGLRVSVDALSPWRHSCR